MIIKKILSVVLSILMGIGLLPAESVEVFPDKTVNVESEMVVTENATAPSKNSAGEYKISTIDHLIWFAQTVNSGSTTIKGRLTANITHNSGTLSSSSTAWTPIGTESKLFKGALYGDEHTISGIYINSTSNYQGLFGCVGEGAVISGITLKNTSITGGSYVGGLVGYLDTAKVVNCKVNATVKATGNYAGVMIGCSDSVCTITNSMSEGSVTGVDRVGGIVGYGYSNPTIKSCKNLATVTATNNYAGGITGFSNGATINHCYNRGNLEANNYAGGMIGYALYCDLFNSYTTGQVTNLGVNVETADLASGAAIGKYSNSTLNNFVYDREACNIKDSVARGRRSAEIKRLSFINVLNDGTKSFMYDYVETNNGYPVLAWELADDIWDGIFVEPKKDSSGTYLITKGEELAWFAAKVNGTLPSGTQDASINGKLTSNIVLNVDASEEGGANEFMSIGVSNAPYSGTFDGNNRSINGLYINNEDENQGLFGYIGSKAVIKNVTLNESYIRAGSNVGAIVGYSNYGTVQNCTNNSTINVVIKNGGGIVGYNNGGTIKNCVNTGNVTATASNIGGIVGYSYMGNAIDDCHNTGSVSGIGNVGGIGGYVHSLDMEAKFKGFYNTGAISGTGSYIGGIIGNQYLGEITYCFNMGSVSGGEYAGGLIGNLRGTVNYAYNTGNVSGTNVGGMAGAIPDGLIKYSFMAGSLSGTNVRAYYAAGTNVAIAYGYYDNSQGYTDAKATGLSTDVLTGSGLFTYTSFIPAEWIVVSNTDKYYFYPQIPYFANSAKAEIKSASEESVKFLRGDYCIIVETDTTTDYFTNLTDAAAYIGEDYGTITVTKDISINSKVVIDGEVTLRSNGPMRTLSRGKSYFYDDLFLVNGDLTLGEGLSNFSLVFDGAADAGVLGGSGFRVESGASLYVYNDVITGNFKTMTSGGAFYVVGTVNIYNSNISACSAMENGGAVYVAEGGFFNSVDTDWSSNSAIRGGVIYNNNATAFIKGGYIYENTATNGAVLYNNEENAVTSIENGAKLYSNYATSNGGAIYNYKGTTNITGELSENESVKAGGGIYNESGIINLYGGIIGLNNSYEETGNAIYNNGKLYFRQDAYIDTSNDVYLKNGRTITFEEELTYKGTLVSVKLENYAEGTPVFDGEYTAIYHENTIISDNLGNGYYTNSTGYLLKEAPKTVAVVTRFGFHDVGYTSLTEAVESVGTDVANITIVSDCVIDSQVVIEGEITILCYQAAYMVRRSEGMTLKDLFLVKNGATLELGDSAYTDETVPSMLTIDGGSGSSLNGGSVIKVESGARCNIYPGVSIINNKNMFQGGAIINAGELTFAGGLIGSNVGTMGAGAIYNNGGTVTLGREYTVENDDGEKITTIEGGTISGNTANNNGGAIWNKSGTVNIICSNITNNTTTKLGNAIYNDGTLTVKDKAFINADNDVYLPINRTVQVVGEITSSEPIMRITPSVCSDGIVVLEGDYVEQGYVLFTLSDSSYTIAYDGTIIGMDLTLKSDATIILNDTFFITNIDLEKSTVADIKAQFVNDKDTLRLIDINGNEMADTQRVTTGSVLQFYGDDVVFEEYEIVIFGDVNCDGYTDGNDAVIVQCLVLGMLTQSDLSQSAYYAADADHSGKLARADYALLNKVGLMTATINQNVEI